VPAVPSTSRDATSVSALDCRPAHTFVVEARNGALMAYGVDLSDNYRRAADCVNSILRGAKIADLPFQEPTNLILAINMRTARFIHIPVSPTLLALAAEVIE
jgi:putative tryptophan/tyrosine transport system substrate-binding protein